MTIEENALCRHDVISGGPEPLKADKPSAQQIGGNHYKDMAIQPSEFIHRNELNWCEGSAIKYICRHHLKGGRQDLEKAIHYLNLLIEWEYAENADKKS